MTAYQAPPSLGFSRQEHWSPILMQILPLRKYVTELKSVISILVKKVFSKFWKMLVARLCQTLCDLIDCSPQGSSVQGIRQSRILEWVASLFSRGSSWPRDWTKPPALKVDTLPSEPSGKLLKHSIKFSSQSLPQDCDLHGLWTSWIQRQNSVHLWLST